MILSIFFLIAALWVFYFLLVISKYLNSIFNILKKEMKYNTKRGLKIKL